MCQKVGMMFVWPVKKSKKRPTMAFTGTFYFQVEKRKHCVGVAFMRKINFVIRFFEVHHNSETEGESNHNAISA